MKTLLWTFRLAALSATLAVTGCGGIHFDVGQDIAEQRVAGSPLGGLLPSFIPSPIPITVDIKAQTQAMGTGPASRAELSSFTLDSTPHGGSATFDFLSEVHIFVESSNQSAGLPRREIATLKPVPRGQKHLDFTIVPGIDLLPYINAGAVLTANATGTVPPMDFTYDGHVIVTVFI